MTYQSRRNRERRAEANWHLFLAAAAILLIAAMYGIACPN